MALDLPIEILIYIFKFLPFFDKLAASHTCRLWYSAANNKEFVNKKLLCLCKDIFEDDSPISKVLKNPFNSLCNIVFQEIEVVTIKGNFWVEHGSFIKSLTFDACDIPEKVFSDIINECVNLESLTVNSCKELFMSGRLLEEENDCTSNKSLKKLKRLSLTGNRYLSDAIFNRFVSMSPLLEELCLSECPVSFHLGLYQRFYPRSVISNGVMTASKTVLTFHNILQFLISQANHLKKLSFSETLFDGNALLSISQIPNLNLEVLELKACMQLRNLGIVALTMTQMNLKVLDISACSRVTDESLISICNGLVNLEVLNIEHCRAVTDMGLSELCKLKKITNLNISQCESLTSAGIENGICKEKNGTLLELKLSSLCLDERIITIISEMLPNLTLLDVSYCFNAVTDVSVQSIFKNLICLKALYMCHCDKISDAGFTGMDLQKFSTKGNQGEKSEAVTENLNTNNYSGRMIYNPTPRISLRSRAEEEIVKDTQRKLDVMKMCEDMELISFQGYSLARLKGLRELNVRGCNRMSDVSLMFAFNFRDLRVLNLSNCQQITHGGMYYVSKHCPSIDTLDLSHCNNMRDDGTVHLVTKLSRLKYLNLKGCSQLTDVTLEAIRNECKSLKTLDVQSCPNMSPEVASSLSVLPTLRKILVSKAKPFFKEIKNFKIPSPPR